MKLHARFFLLTACALFCISRAGMAADWNSELTKFEDWQHQPKMGWEASPPYHALVTLSATPKGYSPAQIRNAYNFFQIQGTGVGQKIAIIDAYGSPTIQRDLDTFSTTFGIPKTTVSIVYPQGKPYGSNSGWALETSLDVEWAHAIAPGAQIILVVARTSSFSDLIGAVNYAVGLGAKQISMSWGGSEFSGELNYDNTFNKAGVTFTASSGDNGSGVLWPAASPNVISVGGTTLKLGAQGNVISEVGWKGSGGGISRYEKRPAFQNGWNAKTGRSTPDVSYAADPTTGFAVYSTNLSGIGGWTQVGGTSAGAPQWAALAALANGFRVFPLDTPVSSLYAIALTDYPFYFHDVTSGNNGGYSALPKYDYVTGLGTPLSDNIVLQLGNLK